MHRHPVLGLLLAACLWAAALPGRSQSPTTAARDTTATQALSVVTVVNPEEPVRMLPAGMPVGAFPETPPWALRTGAGVKYYISSSWTFSAVLSPGRSLLSDTQAFDPRSFYRVSTSNIFEEDRPQPELLNPITYWRRNAYGVFSAHLIKHSKTGRPWIVAFLDGQNKNEKVGPDRFYINTVLPPRSYAGRDFSGYNENKSAYVDNWDTYFNFIGLAACPLDDYDGSRLMSNDQGPILWPSTGYLDPQGRPLSRGVRHPSTIVEGGYIYVFYLEEFPGSNEPGRQRGIKVARAPVASLGRPGSFVCWFEDAFTEPSLPAGFSRLERGFFNLPGGRGTRLFDEYATRFSVARLAGRRGFLGVEERMYKGDEFELFLRLSDDLVHWGKPFAVPNSRGDWKSGLHYPILANADLTDNNEIDPANCCIVGSVEDTATSASMPRVAVRRLQLELK